MVNLAKDKVFSKGRQTLLSSALIILALRYWRTLCRLRASFSLLCISHPEAQTNAGPRGEGGVGSNPLYKQLHFEDKVTYTGESLKPAQCEFIDISELWSNRGSRIRTCDFHFMGVARYLFSVPHYNNRAGWI